MSLMDSKWPPTGKCSSSVSCCVREAHNTAWVIYSHLVKLCSRHHKKSTSTWPGYLDRDLAFKLVPDLCPQPLTWPEAWDVTVRHMRVILISNSIMFMWTVVLSYKEVPTVRSSQDSVTGTDGWRASGMCPHILLPNTTRLNFMCALKDWRKVS